MRIWDIGVRIKDEIEWKNDQEAAEQITAAIRCHLTKAGIVLAEGKPRGRAIVVIPSPADAPQTRPLENVIGREQFQRLKPLAQSLCAVAMAWQLGLKPATVIKRVEAGDYGEETGLLWYQLAATIERESLRAIDDALAFIPPEGKAQ